MNSLVTYQDYLEAVKNGQLAEFIGTTINWHEHTSEYLTAVAAEAYDRQQNTFILNFTEKILTGFGESKDDPTSSFKAIPSNFFHELNVQRVMYSLGNGIILKNDSYKDKIAVNLVKAVTKAALFAIEQGKSFIFRNKEKDKDKLWVFPLTEFIPLIDEESGELMAGIRHWQIADNKPKYATLYTINGSLRFIAKVDGKTNATAEYVQQTEDFEPYLTKMSTAANLPDRIDGFENPSSFPIVQLSVNDHDDSSLIGMKEVIDNYDLILSGFAKNVNNCQAIYWLVSGADGMNEKELKKLRENALFRNILVGGDGQKIEPYTAPIPTEAHEAALAHLRKQIYEDFGAVDVKEISAAAKTATEIKSSYEPMDKRAKDFEEHITDCLSKLAELAGITEELSPDFKRDQIVNEMEQTQMVLAAQNILDDETILENLSWIAPDKIDIIMQRKAKEQNDRFITTGKINNSANEAGEGGTDD